MSEPTEKVKKPREKRVPGTLPISTAAVLRRVANGEALVATRSFPYDWTYHFDFSGVKVGVTAVAALVEGGYLTATQSDPCADYILYHITDAGMRYVKNGPPPCRRLANRPARGVVA